MPYNARAFSGARICIDGGAIFRGREFPLSISSTQPNSPSPHRVAKTQTAPSWGGRCLIGASKPWQALIMQVISANCKHFSGAPHVTGAEYGQILLRRT